MATLWDDVSSSAVHRLTIQLVLVELKDRKNTRIDEIAVKLFYLTHSCFEKRSKSMGTIWAALALHVRQHFPATSVDQVGVKVALVIAGRCQEVYTLVGGKVRESCLAQTKKVKKDS